MSKWSLFDKVNMPPTDTDTKTSGPGSTTIRFRLLQVKQAITIIFKSPMGISFPTGWFLWTGITQLCVWMRNYDNETTISNSRGIIIVDCIEGLLLSIVFCFFSFLVWLIITILLVLLRLREKTSGPADQPTNRPTNGQTESLDIPIKLF